MHGETVKFVSL